MLVSIRYNTPAFWSGCVGRGKARKEFCGKFRECFGFDFQGLSIEIG